MSSLSVIGFSKMLKLIPRIPISYNTILRNINTSTVCRIREIVVEKKDEKTTVIDCKYLESPRVSNLIKLDPKSPKCPLCQLQLNLKHTDVLILSQYIDSKGNILRHKDTHLCKTQYKLIRKLIFMAQYAGLLPEPPRSEPKKPYNLLNTYYDETTINLYSRYSKPFARYQYIKYRLSPTECYRIKPDIGPYYGPKE